VRLLLIEDDPEAARLLADGLVASGHQVTHATSAEAALEIYAEASAEAMIVDRMLPGRDGLWLIAELRERGVRAPVLILSALGQVDDRVAGLRAGGDDYLVKPFHLSELLARLEAMQRRSADSVHNSRLVVGDLEIDLVTREARRGERSIDLTPREFRLLECLMRATGQVVTRRMLLEQVWGYHFDPQTNVIDVHISRLRQAIGDDRLAPLVTTVRGAGYVLAPPVTPRVP
jgi:two-component system OmpR family response regulator